MCEKNISVLFHNTISSLIECVCFQFNHADCLKHLLINMHGLKQFKLLIIIIIISLSCSDENKNEEKNEMKRGELDRTVKM